MKEHRKRPAPVKYLDFERLDEVDSGAFRSQKPFPWVNPQGLLTEDGYRRLLDTLPGTDLFARNFDVARKHGQRSHDRFNLEYRRALDLSEPWRAFLAELQGDRYRRFLERLFGRGAFRLRFHWHYATNAGSVSPHCDSNQKLGSHIFYLNSTRDWDPAWGGETLVLDDGGRFGRRSSPEFEEFDRILPSQFLDNRSFIFRRTAHSWHGVREIHCPDDALRKIFIVVIDGWNLRERILTSVQRRNVERY